MRVGTSVSAQAFGDTVLSEVERATAVLVDRRDRSGAYRSDAYFFVRWLQPAVLVRGGIASVGPNEHRHCRLKCRSVSIGQSFESRVRSIPSPGTNELVAPGKNNDVIVLACAPSTSFFSR